MRFEGTLKSWNDDRGFGFLTADQGGEDIFVHIKAIRGGGGRPQIGQRLSFEVELGPQGRKRARDVQPTRPMRTAGRRPEASAAWTLSALLAVLGFALLALALTWLWRPPAWIGLLYLGASALTVIAYALDKMAARRGAWRMQENTLHLMALVGGWPGALLAQFNMRHKTTKREFRRVFWVTVALNVAGFVVACAWFGRPGWRPFG